MTTRQEELRQYCAKIRPVYCELYSIAHVILGNAERAEAVVRRVIAAGWHGEGQRSMRLGFRDGMRSEVKRAAYMEAVRSTSDVTWDGLAADEVEGASEEPFLRKAADEDAEHRRILALHYGCGFSAKYIGKLLDMPKRDVQRYLQHFEHKLHKPHKDAEAYCRQIVRTEFAKPDANAGGMAAVYRMLQSSEGTNEKRTHPVLRYILRSVAGILTIAILGAIFWLMAVLIQSPKLEAEPMTVSEAEENVP